MTNPEGSARLRRRHGENCFNGSRRARALLGVAFVGHVSMICEAEDASLRRAVGPEEAKRYLEAG